MDINFCGYKNVGFIRKIVYNGDIYNPRTATDFSEECFLSVQLTDDFNGKDLTEYKKLLSTTDMKKTPNPIGRDFVNISIAKKHHSPKNNNDHNYTFFINKNKLDVNDNNLKFLSYIVKLVKRIAETPEKKLIHNIDFLNGPDSSKAILLGEDLEQIGREINEPSIKEKTYNPKGIKACAEHIFNKMQNVMIDYFS